MTTTSPGFIAPPKMALQASSSESKTRAGPLCRHMPGSTALFLTTPQSGARLPRMTLRPPSGE